MYFGHIFPLPQLLPDLPHLLTQFSLSLSEMPKQNKNAKQIKKEKNKNQNKWTIKIRQKYEKWNNPQRQTLYDVYFL